MRRGPSRMLLAAAAGSALCGVLLGCGPRLVRETVVDEGGLRVILRGPAEPAGGAPAYEHPMVISSARAAHILSRIDLREGDGSEGSRKPAVEIDSLYPLADALAQGLEKATPHQEVAVMLTRRERRFGIFTHDYLTSFVAYRRADQLHIHFSHVDWELPRGSGAKTPEPRVDREVMKFRLVPGAAMALTGAQSLAINWRDPIFDAPTAVQISPVGRARRRTILMESDDGARAEPSVPGTTPLSPRTLRRLADLEEARQRGEVSEAEYQARRAQILAEDAGAP
ncbi:MAG: SHOCT domain-containing protein [Deltaproteobacteria bacterium]|nr:MAG: SHOCT domain-containing protein [Deltaproteobacteria bacterium]